MRFDTLAQMTGGELLNPVFAEETFRGVTIDSRNVSAGNLFIAIQGEHADGHAYIPQALAQGAAGALGQKSHTSLASVASPLVSVADTHEAMMQLARSFRDQLSAKFIGITGSNGKTTTKEFTAQLLSAVEPNLFYSKGNLNNLFGMPLSIFSIPEDAKVAVMEMGISRRGEMARLAQIVAPDVTVFTNIAPSHLEYLGNVDTIATEKLSMVRAARANAPVIVNADDPVLMRHVGKYSQSPITFGFGAEATLHPDAFEILSDGSSRIKIEGYTFHVPLLGQHFAYNLLGAYAIARTLGYDFNGIDTANIKFTTAPMRGQSITLAGVTFLADCYNSNPQSLKAGLGAFAAVSMRGRKILILGDMLELGADEEQYHREIGKTLGSYACDAAIFVGTLSRAMGESAIAKGLSAEKVYFFKDALACAAEMRHFLRADDVVYLKASRGIGLEAVLKQFGYEGSK